jgi:cytochrome b6-f complex iron-sulfur subunit
MDGSHRGAVASDNTTNGGCSMSQGRREFCKRMVSYAACTGALGSVLPACGGNPTASIPGQPLPTMGGTVVNGTVSVSVSAGSPLSSVGGMALVTSSAGDFLVTHTGQDAFLAVTAGCTHQACVVSNFTGQSYVCPCHGSEFDTSGRVIVGPAVAPLRQFATQFVNNVLTIA